MIISASRRTDIPAFYSEWFMNRIKEGYFVSVNPMNKKQKKVVSLLPQDVDVIVFWTKNPGPLLKHLEYLDMAGYKYYFQFTLNSYPPIYEPNVPSKTKLLRYFEMLSTKLGKNKVIWRYDPIILSERTNLDFHQKNFRSLSSDLKGLTAKCVFSFLDYYGKVAKRLADFKKEHGLHTEDITAHENQNIMMELINHMKLFAQENDIELATCAEDINLTEFGIKHNACIDGNLVKDMLSINKTFKKDTNQRKECLCVSSIDMGMYNTCPHKCSYCYGNYSNNSIDKNYAKHKEKSPILIGDLDVKELDLTKFKECQLCIFQ